MDDVRLGPNPGLAFAAGISQGLSHFTTAFEGAQKLQMQKQQMDAMTQMRQMQMQKLQAELAPVKMSAAELALATGMKQAGAEVPNSLLTDKYEKFFDSIKTPGQYQFAMSQVQDQVAKKQGGMFAPGLDRPTYGAELMQPKAKYSLGADDLAPKGDFEGVRSDMAAADGIKANQILGQEVNDIRNSPQGQVARSNNEFSQATAGLPQDGQGNFVLQPKTYKLLQDRMKTQQLMAVSGIRAAGQAQVATINSNTKEGIQAQMAELQQKLHEMDNATKDAGNVRNNSSKEVVGEGHDAASLERQRIANQRPRGSGSSKSPQSLEEKSLLDTVSKLKLKLADADKQTGLIPAMPADIAARKAAIQSQIDEAQGKYEKLRGRGGNAPAAAAPAGPVIVEANPESAAKAVPGAFMNHPSKGWMTKKADQKWYPTTAPKGK